MLFTFRRGDMRDWYDVLMILLLVLAVCYAAVIYFDDPYVLKRLIGRY